RHEYRLRAGQPGPDEGQHILQVVVRAVVKEREMAQATAGGGKGPRRRRCGARPGGPGRPVTPLPDAAGSPPARTHAGEARDICFGIRLPASNVAQVLTVPGVRAWRDSGCRRAATAR